MLTEKNRADLTTRAEDILLAREAHFGGSYKKMFEYHGWTLYEGQHYMHQAAPRIVEEYGSVKAFEAHFMASDTK